MSSGKKIRLFKVASDINIGKEAIVDFLQNKGFEIENKPTALLTDEMVELVNEKFKKEKKAAEKQREKIEKHKQIRKTSVDLKGKRSADDSATTSDASEVSDETILSQTKSVSAQADPTPSEQVSSVAVSSDSIDKPEVQSIQEEKKVQPQIATLPDIKVGDKIELSSFSSRFKGQQKAEQKPVIDEKPVAKDTSEEKPVADEQKIEIPKTQEPAIKEDKAVTQDAKAIPFQTEVDIQKTSTEEIKSKPKFDEKQTDSSKVEASDLSKEAQAGRRESREVKEISTETKKAETGTSERSDFANDKPKDSKSKKRKKKKKLTEIEYDAGESPKLKGLTIVGKIDLNKDKVAKPKRDFKRGRKPVAGESDESRGTSSSAAAAKSKLGKPKKKGKVKVAEPIADKRPDKKKKRRQSIREMISVEDVDRAIKQTLSEIGEGSNVSQRSKLRHKKRIEREEKEQKRMEEKNRQSSILKLTEFVTTADLADKIGVSPNEIILKCMELGLMVSINQRLDKDTITVISDDYNIDVEFFDEKAIQILDDAQDPEDTLEPRSPIVTIMGHVDHGKTSLLDFIRNSNVVAGEAGGITQHIGAYRVALPNKKHITFLDTPGHEAFTAMRARGAQVTDIVILVVAADDSVMPQTIEAISHAQAANVPIIVAINKMDKPDSNPDRIRQQLSDYNVLVEDWGGRYQSVEISAKKGINIDLLLEKILLEAEMLELKANRNRKARATVIEANMSKGFGSVCTVIVQKGTLNIGDAFVAGKQYGRVRALFDERSNKLEYAAPSMPVRVIGFDGLPEAGDILTVVDSDTEARGIASERVQLRREQDFRHIRHVTLDDISKKIQEGGIKDLNLIIKGDVGGSVEALSDSLFKLSTNEVRVSILHKSVGSINESDVMLAVASGAVIIGFQVNPTNAARRLAESEAVDIRLYNIIYDCINEVRLALEGLLTPELKEDVVASVEVRKVFKISRLGAVAGCYVLSGKITRNDRIRVLRNGLPVFTGGIHSLKRGKDDCKEVDAGYECGITLEGFNNIEISDIIEAYKVTEIKRTL